MKICPLCETTFDEEIIKFCTKDGTPLVEEGEPSFVDLPSENLEEAEDDIGEVTVISRKGPDPSDPPIKTPSPRDQTERIVIPTSAERSDQQIRARSVPPYYPIEKPNTFKIVALTIMGTISLLGLGALLFWVFQGNNTANTNINVNTNLGSFNGNLNANSALDSNFNFNTNANFDSNFNLSTDFNSNSKTPTPTPKPSPTPRPTAEPTETPDPTPASTPRANTNSSSPTTPATNATPRTGPRPPGNSNRPPDGTE